MIEHDVKEEEKRVEGMFSQARKAGGDVDELGTRMAAAKKQLLSTYKSGWLAETGDHKSQWDNTRLTLSFGSSLNVADSPSIWPGPISWGSIGSTTWASLGASVHQTNARVFRCSSLPKRSPSRRLGQ